MVRQLVRVVKVAVRQERVESFELFPLELGARLLGGSVEDAQLSEDAGDLSLLQDVLKRPGLSPLNHPWLAAA